MSLLCVLHIFFILLLSSNPFKLVLKCKSMLYEYYFLSHVKNIVSIKRYFHTFPLQDCFVFHLMLFLKGFLVLSGLLKTAFEKSGKENS